MNKLLSLSTKTLVLSGLLLTAFSCSDDLEEANIEMTENVSSAEVKTILNADDYSSAADDIITELFQQSEAGRSAKNEDCYIAEFSDTGYTVDFDNCTLEEGTTINGMLAVTYTEGAESSAFNAIYDNLSVDGIILNGTRNFTVNGDGSSNSFTIVSTMNVELADGTLIEESGTKNFSFVFDFENFEDLSNSAMTVSGNWMVKSDGTTYTINVTSDLVAYLTCEHFGEGIMDITKNGLKVSVDFGDGNCDDSADIIYPDGTVEEISLKD